MKKIRTTVRAKITGNSRLTTMEGRQYAVYPVTILMEGVHHGNGPGGRVLYKLSEMSRYVKAWNQKPITLNHPKIRGQFTSADNPSILTKYKLGVLMANMVEAGGQHAEAWFDVERTKRIAPKVFKNLKKGIFLEVSTGLFVELDRKKGTWRGEKYDAIARNFSPDHLAILPDSVGACSLADGCGLFTAEKSITLKEAEALQLNIGKVLGGPTHNCECQKHKKKGIKMKKSVTSAVNRVKQRRAAKKAVDTLIDNGRFEESFRPKLLKMDLEVLEHLVGDEEEEADDKKSKKKDGMSANLKKKLAAKLNKGKKKSGEDDVEAYIKNAPAKIREVLENGLQAHSADRERLTDIITSNEDNQFEEEELEAMSLPMLKKLASLAVNGEDEEEDYNYVGAAGGARRMSSNSNKQEALECPNDDDLFKKSENK